MPNDDGLRSMRDRARDRAIKLELLNWSGLSVAQYANTTPRATLATMDLATRRLKWVQLPTPMASGHVAPWHLEALLQAAQEAVLAWGNQETLF